MKVEICDIIPDCSFDVKITKDDCVEYVTVSKFEAVETESGALMVLIGVGNGGVTWREYCPCYTTRNLREWSNTIDELPGILGDCKTIGHG